jgi:hypothetical protein
MGRWTWKGLSGRGEYHTLDQEWGLNPKLPVVMFDAVPIRADDRVAGR